MNNITRIDNGAFVAGSLIPQHRLLSRKEWRWIKAGHRYGYWSTIGIHQSAIHHDLHHIDPATEGLITWQPRHRE